MRFLQLGVGHVGYRRSRTAPSNPPDYEFSPESDQQEENTLASEARTEMEQIYGVEDLLLPDFDVDDETQDDISDDEAMGNSDED